VLGLALHNAVLRCGGQLIYTCVSQSTLNKARAEISDLDGIIENLLNIQGVSAAVLLYERKNDEVKISLRSKSINVDNIAREFGGGGHKYAAGATAYGDIKKIAEQVINRLEKELL
jgi:phosphoesterase RecJ-like protein